MRRKLFLLLVALIPAVCGCGPKAATATAMAPKDNSMQPMAILPLTQANGTQHPPSGIDDAAAQPLEALSSANPNERLQVVRQAQDKWGSHKVAQGIDRLAILGCWINPVLEAAHINFNADGTFKDVALLKDTEGTYRFLSHNAIELTYPGMLYGEKDEQVEYRLLGDALEFKRFGAWVRYRRATR